VLVVNNPRAGQSDAGLFEYVRALSRAGAEVVLRPLDAERSLARALRDAEEHDRVVVAGGDGTVASAADLLRNTGIPLLPYPAGTANLIAMNLGEPIDPKGLAEVTLAGRVKRVDLGEIPRTSDGASRGRGRNSGSASRASQERARTPRSWRGRRSSNRCSAPAPTCSPC
jgi:diacylglycerol kinase (ATP)